MAPPRSPQEDLGKRILELEALRKTLLATSAPASVEPSNAVAAPAEQVVATNGEQAPAAPPPEGHEAAAPPAAL